VSGAHFLNCPCGVLGLPASLRSCQWKLALQAWEWRWDREEKSSFPLIEERGVRAGDLFTPLRVAVTGSTASPPLFETLAVLGPARACGRLAVAIERLRAA
jgi:glutamyl/glutaminyl-tRNA synthetase